MSLSICLVHNDISILSRDLCRRPCRETKTDHPAATYLHFKNFWSNFWKSLLFDEENQPCPCRFHKVIFQT